MLFNHIFSFTFASILSPSCSVIQFLRTLNMVLFIHLFNILSQSQEDIFLSKALFPVREILMTHDLILFLIYHIIKWLSYQSIKTINKHLLWCISQNLLEK